MNPAPSKLKKSKNEFLKGSGLNRKEGAG